MSNDNQVKRRRGKSEDTLTTPSSSSSSSSSSPSSHESSILSSPPLTGHFGFTEDGTRFEVPDTLNTTEIFFPHNLSIGSAISGACILISLYLTLFGGFSKWLHIGIFFFWRLSYDLGLGVILRNQSESKSFYKWYLKQYNDSSSPWKARLFNHLATKQLPASVRDQKSIEEYPQIFRAWLVYKNLVNIILVNDGLSYIQLGLKCFTWPESFTLWVILQYIVGIALALFNWWAKVDAHRCIGEYCWYWGDFFFRKDLNLTFDGIFELFPHPMYTVGYSLYYGYSLIARSYTMLFVSLIAHGCQLAFLFFVEEPHIKRTYGSPPVADKSRSRVLYDPKSGWFPDKNDNLFLLNFDLFRSGDFAVLLISVYTIALAFLTNDPVWAFVQVIFWRIVHWIGLGFILWAQSHYQLWTRHFTTRGRTLYEAFGHWKTTYNLSLTMNVIAFIVCAIRYSQVGVLDLMKPYFMACFSLGLVLIALSVWSYTSTYEAVGEFGWFYGDFFISEDSYKQHLCYTGIYRFLNNPDCITGYAGQYGLALITQSWPVFFVALGSHVLNILFLNLVEIPHMSKLYSQKEIRSDADAPFNKALKRIAKTVLPEGVQLPTPIKDASSKLERNIKREARSIRNRAMDEVFEIYKTLSDARRTRALNGSSGSVPASPQAPSSSPALKRARSNDPKTDVSIVTPTHVTLGEGMTIHYSAAVVPREQSDDSARPSIAKYSKSSFDWIGIYRVDVASSPGLSDGKWKYVEPSNEGVVVFPPTLLPSTEGVYEARYHRNNTYTVVASHPFVLREAVPNDESQPSPLPSSPSPPPESYNLNSESKLE